MIGIGIGIPFLTTVGGLAAPVVVTSPSAGTTFYVDTAQSVSLAGVDGTYETSWTSDFAVTNGDITVSSGTGSGNVTAAWADGIASVERATLYIRNKSVGGAAVATFSAPVYTSPHSAVQDGTIEVAYDVGRPSTVTESGGTCTALTPIVGGTAADVLDGTGHAPVYNATDSDFGGRPSIEGTGTQWLQSTTPASAVDRSSDHVLLLVGVQPTHTSLNQYYADSASGGNANIYTDGALLRLAAVAGGVNITRNATDATALFCKFASVDAAMQSRADDGELAKAIGNAGVASSKGLTLFCYKTGAATYIAPTAKTTAALVLTDLSPADVYRLEQWMQLSAARGGIGATGWIAQQAPNVYLENAGWWPTAPSLGVVTVASASIDRDLTTWTQTLLTPAGGYSDPEGGSTAYRLTESIDGSPQLHYIYKSKTASANTYQDWDVWMRTQDGPNWIRVLLGSTTNDDVWVNHSTGAIGSTSGGITASLVESVGDWRHFHFESRVLPTSPALYLEPCDSDGGTTYTGTGASPVDIWLPDDGYGGVVQTRVQQIADQSGVGAHLTQVTAAKQRLFFDELLNSLAVPHHEDGRDGHETTTNAMVLALASGDDPAFAVLGIFRADAASASNCRVYRFEGAGTVEEEVYCTNASNVAFSRVDGVNPASIQNLTCALGNNDFHTFAFIRLTSRVTEVWLDGVYIGDITHDDLGVATMTSFQSPDEYSSTESALADQTFLIGQVPGSNAFERFEYLRGALEVMAAPYNLVGGFAVTFTSPAAGSQIHNMPSTSVTLASATDGTYQLSFDPAFATIRGTVTISGGTGTGTVIPDPADNGSTLLYVRPSGGPGIANALSCTVFAVTGWWPTNPDDGVVTTSEGSLPTLSAWTLGGETSFVGGQSDPDGGSNAYLFTEDNAFGAHWAYDDPINAAISYADFDIWLKPASRDWVFVLFGSSLVAGGGGYLNLTTGAVGTTFYGTFSASVVDTAAGGWKKWHIEGRSLPNVVRVNVYGATGDGTYQYTGTGATCFYIYFPNNSGADAYTQTRVQQIADQSGIGAHLTNATAAQQPLFWVEEVNDIVVSQKEDGRAVFMGSTNAALLAAGGAGAGAWPAMAILTVISLVSNGSANRAWPLSWRGAAGVYDNPLSVNSSNQPISTRYDGSTVDGIAYSGGSLGSVAAVAIICLSDGTRELWIGGAGPYTLQHVTALNPITPTSAASHGYTTALDTTLFADLAVYAGTIPGATAAARYAFVQPRLAAMAAPYGLTA